MKIFIFGAGNDGRKYYDYLTEQEHLNPIEVLAFIDNNTKIHGEKIKEIPIISPTNITNIAYDKIVIAAYGQYTPEILNQLKNMGVPETKIEMTCYTPVVDPTPQDDRRVGWLKNFADYVYMHNVSGNIAECGVLTGRFARSMNKFFPDRKFYMFDTFDGFSDQDVNLEISLGNDCFINSIYAKKGTFSGINSDLVLQSMPNPNVCIAKIGVFPESATEVDDTFCFVNLDMDLYAPMLSALHFFWGKMIVGGIILLHDYFSPEFTGVSRAIMDFEKSINRQISKTPIGDFSSIALIKD